MKVKTALFCVIEQPGIINLEIKDNGLDENGLVEFKNPNQMLKQQPTLKDLLSKHNNGAEEKEDKKNLYEHVLEVMSFITVHYPTQSLEKFEEISSLIKKGDKAKIQEFLKREEKKDYAKHCDARAQVTADHINKVKSFFESKGSGEEEAEEATGTGPVGYIPDICHDNKLVWSQAGINFGEMSCYILQKSMAQFAAKGGVANMRFWGKISGTCMDYWIAEGVAEPPAEEVERPADFEARGASPGVNQFGYWVCNSPDEGKWTALPDISPADINAARTIRVLLTGDLNRKIVTNPFYGKTEAFYLRAQIARIAMATTLAPKGIYRLNEDDKNVIEENTPEEGPIVPPSTLAMANKENWVHYTRSILKCGRMTALAAEGEEAGEEEEGAAPKKNDDPQEKLLKPVSDDCKTRGDAPAWTLRVCGDQTVFGATNPALPDLNYGTIVMKSNIWPGAYSFFSSGVWSQVYLGDGHKLENKKTFFPVLPPTMVSDPVEKPTCVEPQPDPNAAKKKRRRKKGADDEEEEEEE